MAFIDPITTQVGKELSRSHSDKFNSIRNEASINTFEKR